MRLREVAWMKFERGACALMAVCTHNPSDFIFLASIYLNIERIEL